jgi:hypothetical protein
MKVSYFKGLKYTTPEYEVELSEILKDIKNGKWKEIVEPCHENINLKTLLPCFTPTGLFSHRSIKGLIEYNGNFCLDLDKVDEITKVYDECKKIPWIYSIFTSPSGNGLKIIVRSNTISDNFKETEEKLAEMFFKIIGIRRDSNCKDIARIHFISYDPRTYINENSILFK